MSAAAPTSLIVSDGQGTQAGLTVAKEVRERIEQGRQHRKQFEPTWHSNLAFAAGKHWLEWSRFSRSLVLPKELEDKELYTADVITEYRTAALGEIGSDDDRPELLLRRDDAPSEDYQHELNRAVEFGWDYEWAGDEALSEADRLTVDMGTSAVRCRWEPNFGPIVDENVPFMNGKPVLGDAALQLLQGGPREDVQMRQIQQGRICWDPLSPFNLIVPPGVPHERYFPWECVVRPVLLSKVQEEYGNVAASLKEDTDIGSVYGWSTGKGGAFRPDTPTAGSGAADRLRDHVWLFTYYERPTSQFKQGRTITLATNRLTPLRVENSLPYQAPDGTWRSGISYFHWWRVTGRFWSRGLVEVMKDGQRAINKRRTQINEIIDRSMPYTIVQKDSNALTRAGSPQEFVEIEASERQPIPVQGIGPGAWMQGDIEAIREDIDHATGIKAVRLGENPSPVNTYSQLALINENDQGKREQIRVERKRSIDELTESSVHDMRTYWGPSRSIMLAGDEDQIEATVFDATKIPPFFIVKTAKGSAKPRSQAAELQKIEDIAKYSLDSAQPLPVRWFKESLEAGEALELPENATDDQADKAELENHMLFQGMQVPVDYFDPPATHIPIHRSAQIQARLSGQQPVFDLIEQHIQEHLMAAAANAAQLQQTAAPALPAAPPAATPPTQGV